MRQRARALLLAVAVLLVPCAGMAQVLGTVAGNVKDASGAILPGVTVEAASPALIEKVRTAVTDGSGQFRIVNLPPGTYNVTFTLTGFSTVKREGVEISPNVTSTIDVQLRVGAVQETITVTGESPIVDVQSSAQTRSLTAEAFKELPSGGSWIQMAALVPAVHAGNTDVGGVLGDQTGAQVDAHGSRPGDGVSLIDGMRIGNMYIDSNLTNMSLSPLLFDQVDVSLSGQMAETGTNGVIMNAIPKAGGNSFTGSVLANGSGPSLQGNNVTDDLVARGLRNTSTTLKKLYDLNGAVGGPLMRDKLWFYATSRYFTNEYFLAGRFYPADVSAINRTNTDNKGFAGTYTYDNNGRLTWGINDKQKLTGWYAYQYKVDPHWLLQLFNQSPESSRITTWHTQLSTTKWTYTASNHLLFEAGVMAGASPDTIKLDPDQVGTCSSQGALAPRCIAIVDQTAGFTYRAPTGFDFDDRLPSQSFIGAASYVTGSHNVKIGFDDQRGHFWRGDNNDSTGGIWYQTTNSLPAFVFIQAPPYGYQNNLNYNLGLYAQDRWTVKRATVSGGLRFDFLNESTEPFTLGPHRWLPTRNVHFDAVKNVPNWKDIDPRVSVAYDLLGNGKTAVKASASRSVLQNSISLALANNPASTVRTQTQRPWNDIVAVPGGIPGDFVPQCDLTNGAANGECGAWTFADFGSVLPATRYDPAIMNGWGVRPYNWEFSAGVQQEVLPRLSVSLGYFRRIFGNFNVVDNEALSASDFTQYSVKVPQTGTPGGTLPGAGSTISGLFDPNSNASRNVIKDAAQFGKMQSHWDGIDLTFDARLRRGLTLQGGVSTGKTMYDNCEVIDDLPELLNVGAPAGTTAPIAAAGSWSPAGFCHQETPFLAQYKANASYTLPWYGVRVSGTLQSLPGPQIIATNVFNENANNANGTPNVNGYRVATTTLARPFTLGQATVNLVEPGSSYGDRLNQIDLRVTKIVNVGRGRVDLNVDFYNAFNSDAVTFENAAFGPAWRLPLTVIQPRFVKFAARWDF